MTLTFPESTSSAFSYTINATGYQLPPFSEVMAGFGIERRAMNAGLDRKDYGTRVLIALQIGLRDNEDAVKAFEYLSAQEQLEVLKRWAEHSGGEPGE